MSHKPAERRSGDPPVEPDEIEILEVVGVDEHGAPMAPPSDELVVDFGENVDGCTDAAAPAVDAEPAGTAQDLVARERLVRLQADFENLRKRVDRERDDHNRHATSRFAARLLPVLDNFERAIAAGRQPGGIGALLEGVELVQRQLLDELRREGLRDIEALGLPFDPEVHDAVATDAQADLPPNAVVEVMQRGYFFHDRVLRPALVRVRVDAEKQTAADERRED